MSGKPSGIVYSSLVIFWKHRYSFLHIETETCLAPSRINKYRLYNEVEVYTWFYTPRAAGPEVYNYTHGAWNGGLPDNSWNSIQPRAHKSELEVAKRKIRTVNPIVKKAKNRFLVEFCTQKIESG